MQTLPVLTLSDVNRVKTEPQIFNSRQEIGTTIVVVIYYINQGPKLT